MLALVKHCSAVNQIVHDLVGEPLETLSYADTRDDLEKFIAGLAVAERCLSATMTKAQAAFASGAIEFVVDSEIISLRDDAIEKLEGDNALTMLMTSVARRNRERRAQQEHGDETAHGS